MHVKTTVKAGEWPPSTNHSEAQVRAGGPRAQGNVQARPKARAKASAKAAPRPKVRTGVKAGLQPCL